MDQVPPTRQELFVDRLALIYHEARNVRHLIVEQYLPGVGYEGEVDKPTQGPLWRMGTDAIFPTPSEAGAKFPSATIQVFERRFRVDAYRFCWSYMRIQSGVMRNTMEGMPGRHGHEKRHSTSCSIR